MTRKQFLQSSLFALAGICCPAFLTKAFAHQSIDSPDFTPPIYKRFLRFTEYEERPETKFIVIHHTGMPGADKDSTAEAIHEFHQKTNGWAGIGYHYLIRKNGMIEQGRKPEAIGAHAYHYNKPSIGVSLAGNFDIGRPTESQMDSLKELVLWLCLKYRLDPLKKGVIVGHRDLNDTACPGDALYSRLDEIRYAAAAE